MSSSPLRVEQVDGERLELGQPRNQLRDLWQQLVEIEDRRDLASQLEKRDNQFADVRRRRNGRSGGRFSQRRD